MKVAVRGLALEQALPSLWAFDIDATDDDAAAAVLVCGELVGASDLPRVVWTTGPVDRGGERPAAIVRAPARTTPAPAGASEAGGTVAEALAAMRVDYTRQLPQALAELARAVIDARRGVMSLADASMLAHRLHGTAGSYGHAAVGEAAGRLEARLAAGALAPGPLAAALADLAAQVGAAGGPAAPEQPRVLAIGAAPTGCALVPVVDLAAAVRAVVAGDGHALWIADEDVDPAAVEREPVLRDIPVAVVHARTGPVMTAALALVWPGPWSWLFAPAA